MQQGRIYKVFDKNTPAELFGDFAEFINLWRSKHRGNQPPSWPDFQFEDFTDWYGRLSLGEFEGPSSIKIILWGTEITNWWGADLTQKYIGSTHDNFLKYWPEGEQRYTCELYNTQNIGLWMGDLRNFNKGFLYVEVLDLPLVKDGKVSHLLSAYIKRENMIISPSLPPPTFSITLDKDARPV